MTLDERMNRLEDAFASMVGAQQEQTASLREHTHQLTRIVTLLEHVVTTLRDHEASLSRIETILRERGTNGHRA